MRTKLWIVIILIAFAYTGIAQQVMEFTQSKSTGENKTVYFHIKGLGEDEESRSELLNDLLKDQNVISGRIFTSSTFKTRCQLLLPMNITPEYVREILLSHGYDYDFTTISVNGELKDNIDPETHVSIHTLPADDFPKMEISENKEQDKETYSAAKEQWISENERKYKKEREKGTAEFPIVIEKEAFNSFTPEKQQRLLAEPDKYVIKY